MKRELLLFLFASVIAILFSACFGGYSTKLRYSEVQANINSYSESDQIEAVIDHWDNIIGIENPSLKVQEESIFGQKGGGCRAYKVTKNPAQSISERILSHCGIALKDIKNPTEEQKISAVIADSMAFKYINNPSEKVIFELLKHHPLEIKNIENPTEEMKLEAVKKSGEAIEYIKNPSENVQLESVKKSPSAIKYIENPSENIQLAAIKDNDFSFSYIKNPTYKVQKEAVGKWGWRSYEYVKNPTEEINEIFINHSFGNIEYIKNPSERLKKIAKERLDIIEKERIEYRKEEAVQREALYRKFNIKTDNTTSSNAENVTYTEATAITALKQNSKQLEFMINRDNQCVNSKKLVQQFQDKFEVAKNNTDVVDFILNKDTHNIKAIFSSYKSRNVLTILAYKYKDNEEYSVIYFFNNLEDCRNGLEEINK